MSGFTVFWIIITAAVFTGLLAMVAMWRARHRVVVCPETGREVEVAISPGQAARAVFTGDHLKVVGCERWPEKADCDRDCEKHLHA